jgi:hypothetical protein
MQEGVSSSPRTLSTDNDAAADQTLSDARPVRNIRDRSSSMDNAGIEVYRNQGLRMRTLSLGNSQMMTAQQHQQQPSQPPMRRTLTSLTEMVSDSHPQPVRAGSISSLNAGLTPPPSKPLRREASVTTVRPTAQSNSSVPSVIDIFGPEAFSCVPAFAGTPLLEQARAARHSSSSSTNSQQQQQQQQQQQYQQQLELWHDDPEFGQQLTHVEEHGGSDDSSSTDAGEAADLYDLNSLEAGHSVHNGPTTAAVAAAAPVNSSSAALPAPPPALHRLGSSMRSAVSDVSRADSEQLAELREGGDVLAALQCPTANADKSSSARVKQQFSAFHAGHAAAAAVADQEGAVLKHSTVGRGQGGQLAAAAAALAAARRNAGSTTAAATAAGGGAGGDSGDPQDEVSAMLYGLQ